MRRQQQISMKTETLNMLKAQAKQSGLTMSKYIESLIIEKERNKSMDEIMNAFIYDPEEIDEDKVIAIKDLKGVLKDVPEDPQTLRDVVMEERMKRYENIG